MDKPITVFLGGTCNDSLWREELIPMLTCDYFNPVVKDWNEEAQANEEMHREQDDILLYTLTPKMVGVYSVAEVIDDSNKRPERTLVCALRTDGEEEFSDVQWKSVKKVLSMAEKNGAKVCQSLEEVAEICNNK